MRRRRADDRRSPVLAQWRHEVPYSPGLGCQRGRRRRARRWVRADGIARYADRIDRSTLAGGRAEVGRPRLCRLREEVPDGSGLGCGLGRSAGRGGHRGPPHAPALRGGDLGQVERARRPHSRAGLPANSPSSRRPTMPSAPSCRNNGRGPSPSRRAPTRSPMCCCSTWPTDGVHRATCPARWRREVARSCSIERDGDRIRIADQANVVCGGLRTANATIYLIDSVLMPSSNATPTSSATTAAP